MPEDMTRQASFLSCQARNRDENELLPVLQRRCRVIIRDTTLWDHMREIVECGREEESSTVCVLIPRSSILDSEGRDGA